MYVRKIPNWWSLLPACGKKHVAYVFEIRQVKIVCVLPCESLDPPIDRRGLTLFFAGFFWISKLPVTWDPMIVRVVMALMTNFFSWNKMFMRISGYPVPPPQFDPAQKWNKALMGYQPASIIPWLDYWNSAFLVVQFHSLFSCRLFSWNFGRENCCFFYR